MTKAADNILKQIDEYLFYMKKTGRTPSQIAVTAKQKETVLRSLRTAARKKEDKNAMMWDEHKGFPIKVVES